MPKSSVGAKRGSEIAEALKAHGFEVIVSPNPSNAMARANLRDFAAKAEGADLAFAMLIGHGVSWGGQTFFLTTNTEIGRAADLLSRALSTTNIAQIVGRAQTGGVFFFMTSPSFESPIEGLDARPQFTSDVPKNAVTVFSSSARIPVSRIDAAAEQAAEAVAKLLQQPGPSLNDLIKVAASGGMGAVFGRVDDVSLTKPAPAPSAIERPVASITPQPVSSVQKSEEPDGKLEAERRAREQAEARARDEQLRAERAQAEVLKAQADAKKAQADVEKAQADAERAKQEARRVEAQAQIAAAQAEDLRHASVASPVDDAQLGQKQRRLIQQRLRDLGLYTGPLDAIMGPLTREAIMGYQKSRNAAVTGYLTAEQFDALLPKGAQ
ncbi:peptidoglycan-binding protein [Microvirga sp. Marseille-Q2068]|uniref:Peptidoglycan-binding protein n=2 Tax=Microvirga mediterraneensis TaxID=2754695 RepID=A0A838BRB6_9HYPH|nr:peptidoglycan-binding domain-containing protein [Microvirga mediterraneensis]MBA1157609.1 peptidoglycan-binding protein [Microvirga mediterraneensis]